MQMNANRIKKTEVVDKVSSLSQEYSSVFVVSFEKYNAALMEDFRLQLHNASSVLYVAKNSLSKIGLSETAYKSVSVFLKGSVGLVFTNSPVKISKILMSFHSKGNFKYLSLVDGKGNIYDESRFKYFAELPSEEVIKAQLLGLINSVPSRFIKVLKTKNLSLLRILDCKTKTN